MFPDQLDGNYGRGAFSEYFRRLIHFAQMDWESTVFQMFYLLFNPSRVFKFTTYRKQTKNRWARDDPSFVLLTGVLLAVSILAYAVAFQGTNVWAIAKLCFGAFVLDFVVLSVVVATLTWFLANRFMRERRVHSTDQKVEWLYAFDVHLNAFFPVFIHLFVIHFFLLPLLLSDGFLPALVSSTYFALVLSYYFYITFLGFSTLPFLINIVWFLFPIVGVMILYVLGFLVFRVNCSQLLIRLVFA